MYFDIYIYPSSKLLIFWSYYIGIDLYCIDIVHIDIDCINMVKLSQYSNTYEEGKFELMPWEFWTEE